MLNYISYIWKINILKTLFVNYNYFPLNTAFRLPIIIYNRTVLKSVKGQVKLKVKPKFGLLRIGPCGLGIQDAKYSRTIWNVDGLIIINGVVSIGRGCSISVKKNAVLNLGQNFMITGKSSIICQKGISFGNDCLLSWDIIIMDSDFHKVIDCNDQDVINDSAFISIGNHVWIGCRCLILKGVSIADNCVIAANSTISKSFENEHCVIGGCGKSQMVLKNNINWLK